MGGVRRRNRFQEERRGTTSSPLWLTVYSDMMTNLMLFFLLLFAITRLHSVSKAKILDAFKDRFSGISVSERMQEEVKTEKLKNVSYVDETEERIKITLPSPVLFDSGKADLKTAAFSELSLIADSIKENQLPVIVEGHTDNIPIVSRKYPSNWHLSAARAFSVLRYFINEKNISPDRLSAFGYAEFRPIAPNDTEDNRRKNRRIHIIMVKR